jgi:hypothetical protein
MSIPLTLALDQGKPVMAVQVVYKAAAQTYPLNNGSFLFKKRLVLVFAANAAKREQKKRAD